MGESKGLLTQYDLLNEKILKRFNFETSVYSLKIIDDVLFVACNDKTHYINTINKKKIDLQIKNWREKENEFPVLIYKSSRNNVSDSLNLEKFDYVDNQNINLDSKSKSKKIIF